MFLLDYENKKIDIDFDFNLEDIKVAVISVVTGDEILKVITNDGKLYEFDSCDYRLMDFYDGSYVIIEDGKWVINRQRWMCRASSYDYITLDM